MTTDTSHSEKRRVVVGGGGGREFSSEISDTPTWEPTGKIATRYLAPYLDVHHHGTTST